MDTSGNNWNGHGLLVVPKCADPQWVQTHGTPTLDIVAVHGLNGGRWSTWSKEDVMWLNNLLPAKLPTARIMTFGYNADLVINFSALGIRDHARKLLSLLRDERYDTVTASRPIVFICHSLGGIIVKQALRFATNEAPYRELATAACGLVFIATPHRGSDLAYWGSLGARLAKASFLSPPSSLIAGLRNNSTPLMEVSEDFRSIAGNYKIVSFYETDRHPVLRKQVVEKHSAIMELPDEEAIPLDGNHEEVCKFSGEDDPRFGEVWKAIRRVAAGARSLPRRIGFRKRPTSTKFFGRSRELHELGLFLNAERESRDGVVIWGLSGYGKTQLAIQYIDNCWPEHSPVLWIDASCKDSIETSLETAASELQSSNGRCNGSIDDIMRWLCQDMNKSWLMVFDGIDVAESVDIRNYLPTCEHGKFIITTTRSDLHSPLKFQGIELEGVDNVAGSEILLEYLAKFNMPRDQSTETAAMAIARKLEGIPLAIEQAGAFLSLGIVKIDLYTEHFEKKYLEDTCNFKVADYGYSYEKRRTIYAALDMVHEVLQHRNPDSVRLLNISAFLGPGEIEFTMLANAPLPEEHCDFGSNHASSSKEAECRPNIPSWLVRLRNKTGDFATTVQKLEQVCLIKINRQDGQVQDYHVHNMVRRWILGKLSNEEMSEYAVTAFTLTGTLLFDESGLCSTPTIRKHTARLSASLKALSRHVPTETIEAPEGRYASLYGSVASGFGKFCRMQGQLDKAKELLTIGLEYRINSRKPTGGNHLRELEELATVEWRLGDTAQAAEIFAPLLDDCTRVLGDDDAMTLRVANSLRSIRERQSDLNRYEERAYIATRGPKREYDISNEEAPQYQNMDDEEWKLVTSYEESRNLLGENDMETLQRVERLAAYYRRCSRLHDEEPLRELLWRHHSGTLRPVLNFDTQILALRNLCRCYRESGKFTAIRRLLLGTEEPSIYCAAIEGDTDLCDLLLTVRTYNIDERDCYGCSSFHWAVEGGHLPMVQWLLRTGVDANLRDRAGATALHWAARNGDKMALHLLLDEGADITAEKNDGQSALHLAAASGSKDAVKLLLERGSDISGKDIGGQNALCSAAMEGHKDVVQLLEQGSNIAKKLEARWDGMRFAAAMGRKDVVQLLATQGSGIKEVGVDGWTMLHYVVAAGDKDVVQLLLDGGSDIEAKRDKGKTVLHAAAGRGYRDVVQLLLEQGSNVMAKDDYGSTALHFAASRGHKDVVQLLLDGGSDIEAKGNTGRTALHFAAIAGQRDVVQLLLEGGSDVMAEDDDGWTARRWAKSEGHVTLAQQLKPAKHRPFAQAWRYCASKLGTPFTPDAG